MEIKTKYLIPFIAAGMAVCATQAQAGSILAPGDAIIAIDLDGNSDFPEAENATFAIDGVLGSKYLNFGKENSGFIVTPAFGSSIVTSFDIITANDETPRDPAVWAFFGTNDAIVTVDNGTSLEPGAEAWTLISNGAMELPDERGVLGTPSVFNNEASYTSYRLIFLGLKDGGAANSMQIDEIQFYDDDVPTLGDTNGDDVVDLLDYYAVRDHLGQVDQSRANGDVTFDGKVNLDDYILVRDQFPLHNGGDSLASAIPEPASLLLMGLGSLAMLKRSK